MSILKELNWVTEAKVDRLSQVERRRFKLCKRLDEQLGLAKAQLSGDVFVIRRSKTVRNRETGQTVQVDGTKRLKAWYWSTQSGALQFSVRYGAKVLSLGKSNAIEVQTLDDLVAALEKLKKATLAGELDAQIAECAGLLSKGFKRSSK